jgi:hypothetical protein
MQERPTVKIQSPEVILSEQQLEDPELLSKVVDSLHRHRDELEGLGVELSFKRRAMGNLSLHIEDTRRAGCKHAATTTLEGVAVERRCSRCRTESAKRLG